MHFKLFKLRGSHISVSSCTVGISDFPVCQFVLWDFIGFRTGEIDFQIHGFMDCSVLYPSAFRVSFVHEIERSFPFGTNFAHFADMVIFVDISEKIFN